MEVKKKTAKLASKKGYNKRTKTALYKVVLTGTECVWDCRDIPPETGVYEHIAFLPTQSELQTWLRTGLPYKKWAILVYVVPYFSKNPRQEQCFIWRRGNLITLDPKDTYEEALEEGLRKGLKLMV